MGEHYVGSIHWFDSRKVLDQNQEIKEHRIQEQGMAQCLRGRRTAERQYSESVSYKCYKGKAKTEIYQGRKNIRALILE